MKIRKVYEELLKQEKRTILRLKCLSGATAFIFFALFLWAFLGLNVVRKVAKGFKFERGNCVVENSTITGQNVSCECGMHACVSGYPCLKVWVRITDRAEKTEPLKLVLLHNNIYDLGFQCTYGPPCKADEKENFETVLRYQRTKGEKGSVLECYFNPTAPEEVVLDISAHKTATFHALFWPCSVFVIGVCMLLKAWYLGRTQRKQTARPNDVSFPEEWAYNNNNTCRKIKGTSATAGVLNHFKSGNTLNKFKL